MPTNALQLLSSAATQRTADRLDLKVAYLGAIQKDPNKDLEFSNGDLRWGTRCCTCSLKLCRAAFLTPEKFIEMALLIAKMVADNVIKLVVVDECHLVSDFEW